MRKQQWIWAIFLSVAGTKAQAIQPTFSSDIAIPETGRANIYELPENTFRASIAAGRTHAVQYPVEATGILFPAKATLSVLKMNESSRGFDLIKTLLQLTSDFKNFTGFWDWLGLHPYPKEKGIGIYQAPHTREKEMGLPMGVSLIHRRSSEGFTLSCAACHSAELFGKRVIGMTNRFPRDNLFFIKGKEVVSRVPAIGFGVLLNSTFDEMLMYGESRKRLRSVDLKRPEAIGLDTSLAQVALSMAKRAKTPLAERTVFNANHPRTTIISSVVADSKPAVWWNLKYKNRYLSDGSVVSGNPVFTNFLWNEIGRGIDIPDLEKWLEQNPKIVQELTAAVFAAESPKYTDFFGPNSINVERAKRGQEIYAASCAKCHGSQTKNWSVDPAALQPGALITDTFQSRYFEKTPVRNVGTDSGRYLGMQALADSLNPLEFSKKFGIKIEPQKGYVPPPLDGIWARYPYFHNNSIPNLRALMTPPEHRPIAFWMGRAVDKNRDFSTRDVGYPLGSAVPAEWKEDTTYLFDTRKKGLSNVGHYEGIFRVNGVEKYTDQDKSDLIEYLKTL